MKITVFTILFTFVCFNITKARPVSYPGGLTLMLMNSGMKNSLHTHYSQQQKHLWVTKSNIGEVMNLH